MAARRGASASAALAVAVVAALLGASAAAGEASAPPLVAPGLSFDCYKQSCPNVEAIVRDFLKGAISQDVGLAAGLLRLHFHDCFVQGCDASILLDSTPAMPSERQAPPNWTLRPAAFKAINDIRHRLDRECRGGAVVSCADVLALAARDSVVERGGRSYMVPLGRRDSANPAPLGQVNADLPGPDSNVDTMLRVLGRVSGGALDATDLVALSGGHTIGVGHCTSFEKRLFPGTDATMDAGFAAQLRKTCPATGIVDRTAALDFVTPVDFDNKYYVNLVNRKGLLTSDQVLFTDGRTRPVVARFAKSQRAFSNQFAASMLKMGQLKVLTGSQGQVRRNCFAPNPASSTGLLLSVAAEAESLVF
ncbi:hypothetical protein HU200_067422 [Digitaria exilis]|uniref:Peroxidase n=1 Tax=Digitaria exilis TaxID=1010633 RepID=A0A835A0E8_9POAL|nr:hypothetical protein HU200_067422 [Digitaria exilis]CAB3479517.1 unnamed protein product [Digitaria exilis]